MPTENYGGQGAPPYNDGTFVLEYEYINRNGRWADKKITFSEYDKALAKYDSLDNSASIWDTTHGPELCVAKTRIAYYSAQLRGRKDKQNQCTVAIRTSAPHYAQALLAGRLTKKPWVLLPETITEIEEAVFKTLPTVESL